MRRAAVTPLEQPVKPLEAIRVFFKIVFERGSSFRSSFGSVVDPP